MSSGTSIRETAACVPTRQAAQTAEQPSSTRTSGEGLVAPLWHTAVVAGIFLFLAGVGIYSQHVHEVVRGAGETQRATPVGLYVSAILSEWALVWFVWRRGLRRYGITLSALIGGRWERWQDLLRDLALGAALWGLWKLVSLGLDRAFGSVGASSVEGLLPHGPTEIVLFVLVALTAGITEEIVFRGYFQRQLTALTRSAWAGLALQAVLFGLAHGYQGVASCVKIALYGGLFGAMALWRRSLRPGMVTHAASDLLAGILGL